MRHPRPTPQFPPRLAVLLPALLLPGMGGGLPAQVLHSPQVTIRPRAQAEDVSWMWAYATPPPDGREHALANDPRFRPMLRRSFAAPQSFWGEGRTLAEAAEAFLSGPPGRVVVEQNRYLAADSCVAHFCPDRGLLWADLGGPQPLLVFAAIDWISENRSTEDADAAYSLWVFSNRPLALDHLPPALVRSVARWTSEPTTASGRLQNLTRVYVVDPDGTPHPLTPSTIGAHNSLPAETTTGMKVPA